MVGEAHGKKSEGKFTIQFSRTEPAHIHVTEILNRKERGAKAQYIVNAVLYYETHGGEPDTKYTAPIDDKYIEAAMDRILRNREAGGTGGILPVAAPLEQVCKQQQPTEDIVFDDDIESLGADGYNAIASAMEMFRKKP